MSKKIYIGQSDLAKEVKDLYIGISEQAKRVEKAYIGVNGIAKQIYPGIVIYGWNRYSIKTTYTWDRYSVDTSILWMKDSEGELVEDNSCSYEMGFTIYGHLSVTTEGEYVTGFGRGKTAVIYFKNGGSSLGGLTYDLYKEGPDDKSYYKFRTFSHSSSSTGSSQHYTLTWELYRSRLYYSKGSTKYGSVSSASSNAYPSNDKSGSYWYVSRGSSQSQGSLNGSVTSEDRNAYPDNGISGSYWYVYTGIVS